MLPDTTTNNSFEVVIANPGGVLRKFVSQGDRASGTGSIVASGYAQIPSNSDGYFFFSALLSDGPAKFAIYWNGAK